MSIPFLKNFSLIISACELIIEPQLREVLFLDTTRRGDRGFGSTGGISYCNDDNENKELLLEIDKCLAES